jgi:hypothetical protein
MSEVMPMQIRARGNAFATGIGNWLVSTFWAQVSPIALSHLKWKFYLLFVGLQSYPNLKTSSIDFILAWDLAITLPIVYFFFKETKQMTLEDIDLLFGERALGTLPDDLHKGTILAVAEHDEKKGPDVELATPAPVHAVEGDKNVKL